MRTGKKLWHAIGVSTVLFFVSTTTTSAQNFCLDCDVCPGYSVTTNTDVETSCESTLKLTLVIDESRSIADAGPSAIQAVRNGVLAFLQDLECTPVQVAVVEFATNARYVIRNHVPVAQARSCMTRYFDGQGCGSQR